MCLLEIISRLLQLVCSLSEYRLCIATRAAWVVYNEKVDNVWEMFCYVAI